MRGEIGGGTHLIASSLTAALVVPAAVRSPRHFKKIVLVCPTGQGTLDRPSGPLGDAVLGLFEAPILGDSLYHALVSRAGIRYYLEKMAYHDPTLVTEGVVEDYYRAGHGPGSGTFRPPSSPANSTSASPTSGRGSRTRASSAGARRRRPSPSRT